MKQHDNEKAAAAYCGVSVSFLRKRRRLSWAPAYLRIGRRMVYRRADCDAFLHQHVVEHGDIIPKRESENSNVVA
jgi:hypothetical protein